MDTITKERQQLEAEALQICSSDIYYDLANEIEYMNDEDIVYIISCKGDYWKETEGNPTYTGGIEEL